MDEMPTHKRASSQKICPCPELGAAALDEWRTQRDVLGPGDRPVGCREVFECLSDLDGAAGPEALAAQLILLYDGAAVSVRMDGPSTAPAAVRRAAEILVDAATNRPRQAKPTTSEPRRATLDVIRRAFEKAGVEFIDENGGGPGVRLRKPAKGKSGK